MAPAETGGPPGRGWPRRRSPSKHRRVRPHPRRGGGAVLGTSEDALCRGYDLAMLDLDGVVYISGKAVPGAPAHLAAAREAGMRLAFITNNAARTPERVASHLRELGVEAQEDDVVTSAQ